MADEGFVVAPTDLTRIRMTIGEIAALLGIYYPTAKRHIRAIEKAGIATGDYSMTCIADGHGVHPEYYGLEMVSAVAYGADCPTRTQSRTAHRRATPHERKSVSKLIYGKVVRYYYFCIIFALWRNGK